MRGLWNQKLLPKVKPSAISLMDPAGFKWTKIKGKDQLDLIQPFLAFLLAPVRFF